MTREELAARIFVTHCEGHPSPEFAAQRAFHQADTFLAYAAKEKEKTQGHDCDGYKCQHISHYPERCNHNWCSINGGPTHCLHCGAPKVKPDPPKPERGAREFNLYKFADGELRAFPSDQATVVYAGFTAPIFICATREILPGDEHDK